MEGLIIPATESSPEVIMEPEGILMVRGRIMRNQEEFLKEASRWIDEYILSPAERTCVNIFLEYAPDVHNNLIYLLRKILQVRQKHKGLIINWYYEEGDDDILERGEYTSSLLNYPFNYIMISENRLVHGHELSNEFKVTGYDSLMRVAF